jgi:hypothetical protein
MAQAASMLVQRTDLAGEQAGQEEVAGAAEVLSSAAGIRSPLRTLANGRLVALRQQSAGGQSKELIASQFHLDCSDSCPSSIAFRPRASASVFSGSLKNGNAWIARLHLASFGSAAASDLLIT